ncbi:MAG: hypothetical protein D6690_02470 [Nitrospirae bacterium]|nr:MAG: hypothetical protein D6690_02470 [Nitrospirota bacterium]
MIHMNLQRSNQSQLWIGLHRAFSRARFIHHARALLSDTRGLTLLELLVVVFILAAIAFTTLSFTDNADSQFRYEETQRRLEMIRRAIVGDEQPAFAGQRLLSGYVVDTGVRPTTITSLIEQPPSFDPFGGKAPIFDPVPDANGFNNGPTSGAGAEIVLTNPEATLFKGFRGPYVSLTPGTTREFRDGWGNGTTSDPDFGWIVTAGSSITTIQSVGADGQPGGSGPFDQDISTEIRETDWAQDITGLQVRIVNSSPTTANDLRASLLVYGINPTTLTTGWFRTTTTLLTTLTPGDAGFVTFPDPSLSLSTLLPIGQHLLVLVHDGDTILNTTDDEPFPSANPETKRLSFFPHTVLPDTVELIIQ